MSENPRPIDSPGPESGSSRRSILRWIMGFLVVLVTGFLVVALAFWWQWNSTRVSEEKVRRAVVTTLQQETPASFYVTGTLQLTAATTVRNTKTLLPDLLDFSMGTTEASVRLPGRVSYGFDVRKLHGEDIRLLENGVVEVMLPSLAIHAVAPRLSEMEVKTDVGWARLYRSSGRRVEQEAIQVAEKALRQQARQHLDTSAEPQLNTARAIKKMLTPVLQAAGVTDPQFRIRMGPEIVMEPEG